MSYWPWLLALLAAAGAAIWYFRRPRSGYAFAGAGADTSAFDFSPSPVPPVRSPTPQPQAAPAPVPPRATREPAPRTPAPVVGGIVSTRLKAAPDVQTLAPPPAAPAAPGLVSTRLRPWIELDFTPLSAVLDEAKASIEFQLSVFNSGSAPARDVLIEARLFNAGEDQDEAIAAFFANRVAEGDAIPAVAPLQRLDFRTQASILRSQMRLFEAAGRQVFVPLIAFNAVYRWSSGQGQSSMSYILGLSTNGDKMAPLVIGQGVKTFRGLGAREHTLRVRK